MARNNQQNASSNDLKMSIKEYKSFLREVVQRNVRLGELGASYSKYIAPLARSQPGIGKTTVSLDVFRDLDLDCQVFIAATQEPTDLSGIPDIVDTPHGKVTEWIKPEFFRCKPGTGLLFDEVTKAPHMMNALSMLVCERRVGLHKIPDGSTIVSCGNRIGDNAGDSPMPSHLNDRYLGVEVYTTYKHWLEDAAERGTNTLITGYVTHKGEGAFSFNPDMECNPTPRSWSNVTNVLDLNLSTTQRHVAIAGYVGSGAAAAFMTYLEWAGEFDSPEYIIAHPDTARVPNSANEIGKAYAIVSALIGHASVKTIAPIMQYLQRIPQKELVVYAVKDMMTRDSKLNAAPALKQWKLANTQLFAPVV